MPAPRRPRREDPPIRITTAPHNPNDDIDHRRRRYLLSMLIRTLCFVGAVIADGWLRWVLVAGAFLLIKPGWLTDLIGLGLLAGIAACHTLLLRRAAADTPVVAG